MRRRTRSSEKVLFGAYAPPAPASGLQPIDDLSRALNRQLDIVLWYQQWAGWGARANSAWLTMVTQTRRKPVVTWEPWKPGSADQPRFRLARIAAGDFDTYIEAWGKSVRAFGKPVFLRLMHEMNGNWYPWGGSANGNAPSDFVAAWHRVHAIFEAVGAMNVRWVWCPLAEDVPAKACNRFELYYPGARFVDVLALDGYNWGSTFPEHGGWRSFDSIFSSAYDRSIELGPQPVWVAETASASEGGEKAAWVREMFASVGNYPRLRAIIWFHAQKERDWRATSPAAAAAAFASDDDCAARHQVSSCLSSVRR